MNKNQSVLDELYVKECIKNILKHENKLLKHENKLLKERIVFLEKELKSKCK